MTTIMMGAKFNDDEFFKNVYYAKVAGIPPDEMNLLETAALEALHF